MNKAAGPQFNTRVAAIRLAAKLVGQLIGLKNWRSVQLQKFKLLGNDLSGLLKSAEELLHPEPYSREEVCRLLGVNEDELVSISQTILLAMQTSKSRPFYSKFIRDLYQQSKIIIFKSLLTTFGTSIIF